MKPNFFTQPELTFIIYRSVGLTIEQIAEKLGLTPDAANNFNREIHRKVNTLCPNQNMTGTIVLGIAVALHEITPRDLQFIFATLGIHFNK